MARRRSNARASAQPRSDDVRGPAQPRSDHVRGPAQPRSDHVRGPAQPRSDDVRGPAQPRPDGARGHAPGDEGRFAYEGLDRLLHEKARLSILTTLMTRPEGVLFVELKALCRLTDGNLSRHLDLLRESGLVEIWKGFEKKRPQTLCRLTPTGRSRFLEYLREVERVLKDALPRAERARATPMERRDLSDLGWVPL